MKTKFQLLFILLMIIVLSFPSICYSELKTVTGESCQMVTGDNKNINWETDRKVLRMYSIENGLKKTFKGEVPVIPLQSLREIQERYIKNFKVISYTEKGRKICEKVRFNIDTKILQTVISQNKSYINDKDYVFCISGGYTGLNDFLINYIQKVNITISLGIIVDVRTDKITMDGDIIGDLLEKYFIQCIYNELRGKIKIIERRHLNKILEEHKLSVSGITEEKTGKVGKIENLDIILLSFFYEDRIIYKLLKVDTGEILYSYTIYPNLVPEKG